MYCVHFQVLLQEGNILLDPLEMFPRCPWPANVSTLTISCILQTDAVGPFSDCAVAMTTYSLQLALARYDTEGSLFSLSLGRIYFLAH